MSKRIFETEHGADYLMNEYCDETDSKIARVINYAIYCWFMPNYVEELKVEANYLLQKQKEGNLTQWEIKQVVSRGISWLAKNPIPDCSTLRSMNLHFTMPAYAEKQEDTRNDYVKSFFAEAEEIMAKVDSKYIKGFPHPCLGNFASDILDSWDKVWEERVMYDVLSYVVFGTEPQKPITVYQAITFLKRIEEAVIKNKLG